MSACRDLLGRMTGLCLLQSCLAREVPGEVGEVLDPLEWPESRLTVSTISTSLQLVGSAVLGLLTAGPAQSRDLEETLVHLGVEDCGDRSCYASSLKP